MHQGDNMNQKGFTLLELLTVVAIIGIMAAFAVPSYQSYVQKSRRTDAMSALSELQREIEKFRGSCTLYPNTIGNADDCAGRTIKFSGTSNEGYYNLSITAATANSYTIEADPTEVQADDADCDPMRITVDNSHPKGEKGNDGGGDCW
jgi:type IV pilus assembly protein PilE